MKPNELLKPCPFCGGTPEWDGYPPENHEYMCRTCDLWGIRPKWWNHRAPDPDLLVERDKLREAAKAYRDLCTCYRLGTRPSEALFERLDKADAALVESAKQMEEKP